MCVRACVCVCRPLRLLITSGMISSGQLQGLALWLAWFALAVRVGCLSKLTLRGSVGLDNTI